MQAELVLRYRDRKLGKVAPANDKLAHQRIVRLPADLATLYSAVQNFRLDLAKGYHASLDVWEIVQASYFRELRDLMEEDGINHYPGDENGEPWIQVNPKLRVKFPSDRVIKLKEIFDAIFQRNDESLLDSEFYPTPYNCTTTGAINAYHARLTKRFLAH